MEGDSGAVAERRWLAEPVSPEVEASLRALRGLADVQGVAVCARCASSRPGRR